MKASAGVRRKNILPSPANETAGAAAWSLGACPAWFSEVIAMVKRAVKQGFQAHYVLTDSWFGSKEVIQGIRQAQHGALHVICGMRTDHWRYRYRYGMKGWMPLNKHPAK